MHTDIKTIVISPVGEPGSGKSTFSFWLCHQLKMRGISAEFVPEVIKYESYSDRDKARVVSGLHDERLLRLQHRFTKPLVGKVEVIVNDGALEPFFYYSLLRVSPERLPVLRNMMARYLQDTQSCEHRFVSPVRQHAYETIGRRQTEEESNQMRTHLLDTLHQEFGITPTLLASDHDRQTYLDHLCEDVLARRAQPSSNERPRRRM